MDFRNMNVVVTGGSSGLGLGLVEALVSRGADELLNVSARTKGLQVAARTSAFSKGLIGLDMQPVPGQQFRFQRIPVEAVLPAYIPKGVAHAGFHPLEPAQVSAAGKPAAFPAYAAELVTRKVDVIYAQGPAAVNAAREATRTIPIVAMDWETDPVQAGPLCL